MGGMEWERDRGVLPQAILRALVGTPTAGGPGQINDRRGRRTDLENRAINKCAAHTGVNLSNDMERRRTALRSLSVRPALGVRVRDRSLPPRLDFISHPPTPSRRQGSH